MKTTRRRPDRGRQTPTLFPHNDGLHYHKGDTAAKASPPSITKRSRWEGFRLGPRDNIRQLVEQAAAFSGARDEDRNADRIARQTEELEKLIKLQSPRARRWRKAELIAVEERKGKAPLVTVRRYFSVQITSFLTQPDKKSIYYECPGQLCLLLLAQTR